MKIANLVSTLMTAAVFTAGGFTVAKAEDNKQIKCLAMNIYHEARGENDLGQLSIAHVTLNRVNSKKFPNTVCKVVYQTKTDKSGKPIKHKCQFSWYCDGLSDKVRNEKAWHKALFIAEAVYKNKNGNDDFKANDPTKGALFYHNISVQPGFVKHLNGITAKIGNHIFYAWDETW